MADPTCLDQLHRERTPEEARAAVQAFIEGRHRLCIPPNPEDADLVLFDAIEQWERAGAELANRDSRIAALVKDLARLAPFPGETARAPRDPDARVKKGFRLGVEAAAKWVESQETAPHFTAQLRYTLAYAIRGLAAPPASADPGTAAFDAWIKTPEAEQVRLGVCRTCGTNLLAPRSSSGETTAREPKPIHWLGDCTDSPDIWELTRRRDRFPILGSPTTLYFKQDDGSSIVVPIGWWIYDWHTDHPRVSSLAPAPSRDAGTDGGGA